MLTRPYQHLTTKASIDLHHITCISLDISVLIVRFGDQACTCRVDNPTSHQKWTRHPSTKVSQLFDELSNNNTSKDRLPLSVSVAGKQKKLGSMMPCSWHTKLMPVIILMHVKVHLSYQLGSVHCKINTNQQFFEGSCLTLLYLTGSFWQGVWKLDTLFSIMYS